MFKYIFTILLILNSSFALAGRHKISQPGKPDVYVPTLESDGKTLIAQPASATSSGMVTNGAQTIAGVKEFSGAIVPAGGIIGRTDGVAVASGYVGQMSLTGLTAQVVAGKGTVWNVASAVVIPSSPGPLISITLNKGVYLLSAHMLGGSSSGGFSASYYWVIGTTRVTSIYNVDAAAGSQVALPIPMLPITITGDGAIVSIYASLASGVSSYNLQEIYGVRII